MDKWYPICPRCKDLMRWVTEKKLFKPSSYYECPRCGYIDVKKK